MQQAYDLYKTMKANHWEPEDVPMGKDIEQWRDPKTVTDIERWIIRMGIGYFSAAEGIVGDNIQHVVRELVTAPELKLVLGRHAHEENIHADSLLYMISSLGINPHECEAMFEDVKSITAKNEFVNKVSQDLRRDLDMTVLANKQLLAKNIFVFGQCMEGTQFYGLFGMILSLYRQNKFPGIGQMFRYTLRDESNHIELFRNLFMDLIEENREIWTPEFKEELAAKDESPVVRLYIASGAQRLTIEQRTPIVEALLQHAEDADDHNLPLMYWYAAEPVASQGPARAVALLGKSKIPKLREYITRRMAATSSEKKTADAKAP